MKALGQELSDINKKQPSVHRVDQYGESASLLKAIHPTKSSLIQIYHFHLVLKTFL